MPRRAILPRALVDRVERLRFSAAARAALIRYRHGTAPRQGIPSVAVVVPEVAGAMRRASLAPRGGWPPVIRTRKQARAVRPGHQVWVDDIDLLRHVPGPLEVHILRMDSAGLRDPASATGTRIRLGTARVLTNTILFRQSARIVRLHQPWLTENTPGWAAGAIGALRRVLYIDDAPTQAPRTATDRPADAPAPLAFVQERRTRVHLPDLDEQVRLDRPVGVFVHLYYDELAEVFAERLSLIDHPTSLYVTTDTVGKARRIASVLRHAEIRVSENRGRDIRPKLYEFAQAYDEHDVVLHLHGKRSVHAGELDAWLAEILDSLLTSPGSVRRILEMFATMPRLGLVVPRPFEWVLPSYTWGPNRFMAEVLAWHASVLPLPDDDDLCFPAGSMFWGRTEVLRPLVDLALTPDDFPPEAGQVDGTLAHTLERLVGVSCLNQGLDYLAFDGREPFDNGDTWLTFDDTPELADFLARHREPTREA